MDKVTPEVINKWIEEWIDFYKKYPNDVNLLGERIFRVMALNENELARVLINKSISLDPSNPETYFMLYKIDKSWLLDTSKKATVL